MAHRIRLATAAHMPVEHLGRRKAVRAPVACWGRSDHMAGEVLAEPGVGERASARGSIEHLQEAVGGFVVEQEGSAVQCCWRQTGCVSCGA